MKGKAVTETDDLNDDDDALSALTDIEIAYIKFLQFTIEHGYALGQINDFPDDDINGKTLAQIWDPSGQRSAAVSRVNSLKINSQNGKRSSLGGIFNTSSSPQATETKEKRGSIFRKNSVSVDGGMEDELSVSEKEDSPKSRKNSIFRRSAASREGSEEEISASGDEEFRRPRSSSILDKKNRSRRGSIFSKNKGDVSVDEDSDPSEKAAPVTTPRGTVVKSRPSDLDDMFKELDSLTESEADEPEAPVSEKVEKKTKKSGELIRRASKIFEKIKDGAKSSVTKMKAKRLSKSLQHDDERNSEKSVSAQENEGSLSDNDESEAKDEKEKNKSQPQTSSKTRSITLLSPRSRSATLVSAPKKVIRQIEERLDAEKLDELILMMMLLCPAEDGPENYRVKRVDIKKVPHYELERIGSSPICVEPIQDGQLQSRSVLFCLDRMRTPVQGGALKKIIKMSGNFLQKWFSVLINHNIEFRAELAEDIFFNFKKMQQVLRDNPAITKLELLEVLDPQMKECYVSVFEQSEVLGRYKNLPTAKLAETLKLGARMQDNNFKQVHDDWQKIDNVKDELLKGSDVSFKTLKLSIAQEAVLNTIKEKDYATNKLLPTTVVKCINAMVVNPKSLDLSFAPLDKKTLTAVFTTRGKLLISLALNSIECITDDMLTVISKYCQNIKYLSLRNTKVTTINVAFNVVKLDLSNNKQVTSMILGGIAKKCLSLRTLVLAETAVNQICVSLGSITNLDLFGCDMTTTLFDSLRVNAQHLKSLRVNSAFIIELNMEDVNFLTALDVSYSRNLVRIFGLPKSQIGMIDHTGLQVLRANNCPQLRNIFIDDAQSLMAVYANNCALEEMRLSTGLSLNALNILEVSDNKQLHTLLINPVRMTRFMAQNCHQIKNILNDVLCRRLLDQVTASKNKANLAFASSALTVLLRVKPNVVSWAMQDSGKSVFHNITAPGVDARCANLAGARFVNADLRGIKFAGANLRNSCFSDSILNGVTFDQLPSLSYHNNFSISAVTQNRAGTLFVSADVMGMVKFYDPDKLLHAIEVSHAVNVLIMSPDQKQLVIAGSCVENQDSDDDSDDMMESMMQYVIIVYDIDPRSEKCYQKLFSNRAHTNPISSVLYTHNGQSLISASHDYKVKMFDAKTGIEQRVIVDLESSINALSLHANGFLLAIGEGHGSIYIRNIKTSHSICNIQAHASQVRRVLFTLDGRFLISGGKDKLIKIWNVTNWKCERTLAGHKESVECLAVTPDNKFLCSGDAAEYKGRHSLLIWNIKTGELIQQFNVESSINAIIIESAPRDNMGPWKIQVACQDGQVRRFLFNENDPIYSLPERPDLKTILYATNMDTEDAIGFTKDHLELLLQFGATTRLSDQPALKPLNKSMSACSEQDDAQLMPSK